MSFDLWSYRLGKGSVQAFKEAARKLLGGTTDAAIELGEAAPYICGEATEEDLAGYELHAITEWLERPEGPPPSARFAALRRMLQQCRGLVDDRELEKLAERYWEAEEPGEAEDWRHRRPRRARGSRSWPDEEY